MGVLEWFCCFDVYIGVDKGEKQERQNYQLTVSE